MAACNTSARHVGEGLERKPERMRSLSALMSPHHLQTCHTDALQTLDRDKHTPLPARLDFRQTSSTTSQSSLCDPVRRIASSSCRVDWDDCPDPPVCPDAPGLLAALTPQPCRRARDAFGRNRVRGDRGASAGSAFWDAAAVHASALAEGHLAASGAPPAFGFKAWPKEACGACGPCWRRVGLWEGRGLE